MIDRESTARLVRDEAMQEPNVRNHPLRDVVFDALVMAQNLGENSPAAMVRATRAIVDAHPDITLDEAFHIVWNIWGA